MYLKCHLHLYVFAILRFSHSIKSSHFLSGNILCAIQTTFHVFCNALYWIEQHDYSKMKRILLKIDDIFIYSDFESRRLVLVQCTMREQVLSPEPFLASFSTRWVLYFHVSNLNSKKIWTLFTSATNEIELDNEVISTYDKTFSVLYEIDGACLPNQNLCRRVHKDYSAKIDSRINHTKQIQTFQR